MDFTVTMTGNKKIIHFLSASDRINYGDLLFPIIFKKFAEVANFEIKFYNYGIIKSDLRHFGALRTLSYKKLIRNIEKFGGNLIIGGGEVFFANWRTLYSFINPFYVRLIKMPFFEKLDRKFNLTNLLLSGNRVVVPFCPSNKELNNNALKIYYNSVGGSFNGYRGSIENLKIYESLNNCSLLSVRDNRTFESMREMNLTPKLVPDSAIIMSDFFKKKNLNKKISFLKLPTTRKYIFLQLGRHKGPKNLKNFSIGLKKLSNDLDLDVILCPIGKAPRHEDNVILKKLNELDNCFQYINPENIYDIMYLISNSALYMGTSLHGLITAQSYNVPFIGLNPELIKVQSYINTWIDEKMTCLSFDEISIAETIYRNWNFKDLREKTIKQKLQVKENLSFILDGK